MKPKRPYDDDVDAAAANILQEGDPSKVVAPANVVRPEPEEQPELTDEQKDRVALLKNKLAGRAASSQPLNRKLLRDIDRPVTRNNTAIDDDDSDARKVENDRLASEMIKVWAKEIPERQLFQAMTDSMSGARYMISVQENPKTHREHLTVEIMLAVPDEEAGQSPLHNNKLIGDIRQFLRDKRIKALKEGTHELGVYRAGYDGDGKVIYKPALRTIPINDGIDADTINRSLEAGHITLTSVLHERIKRSKGFSEDVDMKLTLVDSKPMEAYSDQKLKDCELGKLLLKMMQLPLKQRGKFFIQPKALDMFQELAGMNKEPVKAQTNTAMRIPELVPEEPPPPAAPLNDDSQEIHIEDFLAKQARFNYIKAELRKAAAYATRVGGREGDAAHEKGRVLISVNMNLPSLTDDDRAMFLEFVQETYGTDRVRALPGNQKIYIASNTEIPKDKNPQAFVTENKQRIIAEEFGLLLGAGRSPH